MPNLFDQTEVAKISQRIENLKPDTQRQWGKMEVAQMLAHINASLETARGLNSIERAPLIGRLIGGLLKSGALSEKPFGKNSPTVKSYMFNGPLHFETEKEKVMRSIKEFNEGGPSHCTSDPHPFFGKFTPEDWAVFQWKHIDHHLRQFGV